MDEERATNRRADAVDTTFDLVERAKTGDSGALNDLFARYMPSLRRWASGRLPRWTRDLMDTDDLVQETVVRAVKRMDRFESRHQGALQAYLRQAIVNRIRD
jgi:RNA polymerase sigma factor (sigma-70 family)